MCIRDRYNSVINKGMVKYHKDLDSIGISAVHRIYSFDNRTALEALANVRYYMIRKEFTQNLPYGFSKYKEYSTKAHKYTIYKNDYCLLYTSYKIEKAEQKIKTSTKAKTYKSSTIKKKGKTFNLKTKAISKKVTYKVTGKKSAKKYIKVSKNCLLYTSRFAVFQRIEFYGSRLHITFL